MTSRASRVTNHDRPHTGTRRADSFVSLISFVCAATCGCAALSSWDGFAGAGDAGVERSDAGDDVGPNADAATATDGTMKPIAFVQANSVSFDNGRRSTVDVPLNEPIGAADLIVVAVGWYDTTNDATSVTDTNGNTYVRAVGPTVLPGSNATAQSIFFAAGVKAAPTNVVTATFSGQADSPDVRVVEYSGLAPKNPLDATAAAMGKDSNAASGTATTHFARELLFGAAVTQGDFNTAGSGFTVRIITTSTNLAEERIVANVGAFSAEAPLNPGAEWVMQLATFH
jgi:hypothetical protein